MIAGYWDLARLHAPLLVMLAPLAGAALAIVAPARANWLVAALASIVAAVLAWDIAVRALLSAEHLVGTIEGVSLYADGVAIFGASLIASALALVTLGAAAFVRDFSRPVASIAFALLLCVGAGWIAALFARDLVGMLAAVEFAWIAGVGLLGLSPQRGAQNGAMRMLMAGGVSSALFLLGVGLAYRGVGDVDILMLSDAHIESVGLASAGYGLIFISLALKAGVAPMHFWVGAAFGRAGRLAALALGVLGMAGALAVIIRVASFAIRAPAIGEGVSIVLAVFGAISVVVGSVQAVGARNVLRLAAYASVAQAGVALLCAALGSPAGFAAALVQLAAMVVAASGLIGGVVFGANGVPTFDALDGLGRRAPLASAAITASAVSLMGAPLTIGFLGRWRLVEAGVGAGWWWAAGAVIVTSLAGVFYGGRLVERVYFRRASVTAKNPANDVWRLSGAPLMIAAIAVVMLGLAPSGLLHAADGAAALMAAP